MSLGLLLPPLPPGNDRLNNPYTPTWPPRCAATTPALLPRPQQPRKHSPATAGADADAEAWGAEPADASGGGRFTRSRGARAAAGATKSGGSGGGRAGSGKGGAGDGGDDGDDDGRERKRKGAAAAIDVPSDDSDDDEESESEDETAAPAWKGVVEETAADDKPPARYFGTFTKKLAEFREPPPTRRLGRPPPVPREEREAPWGETWWADRMATFDFGETIFATAYQSLQITADLLRNDEGKRPKMAPPETLPWQSRFGLPQPEDMPLMRAFDKQFESKGVWDLKGPLPELFGKDGEVNPLTVFPLHGDVNLPTPPPEIEETTTSKKGKRRAMA